jgi:serine/threonine protein kinase
VLEAANGTLEDLLSRADELPFRTQISLARDIARGLMAIHNCRIIHGDVKPANILVIGSTSAKIADFSHSWTDTGKPIRIRVGTTGFMAPEMFRGDLIRNARATDVFSLGVVLWRIFTANEKLPTSSARHTGDLDHQDHQDHLALKAVLDRLVELFEATANEPRYDALKRTFCASLSEVPEKRSLYTVRSELSRLSPDGHIIDHSEEESLSSSYGDLRTTNTVPELDLKETFSRTQVSFLLPRH